MEHSVAYGRWTGVPVHPMSPPGHEGPKRPEMGELSAADLFATLWDTLADMLGTGATAVLLRRAVRQAADEDPSLKDLVIRREGLEYNFSVPTSWRNGREDGLLGLRRVVRALRPILTELTGHVVLRRLERLELLRLYGLVGEEE